MPRTLILCALTALLLSGCANGWPSARHPLRGNASAKNCVPTSSKIDRADCKTPDAGGAVTGADIDRGGQEPQRTGRMGTFGRP